MSQTINKLQVVSIILLQFSVFSSLHTKGSNKDDNELGSGGLWFQYGHDKEGTKGLIQEYKYTSSIFYGCKYEVTPDGFLELMSART